MVQALVAPAAIYGEFPVRAVADGVVQQRRVTVRPLEAKRFRPHLPDGLRDFTSLEDSVACAEQVVSAQLEALARKVGASHVEMQMVRVDETALVGGGRGQRIYPGTELTFTAVGRPSLAREM